MKRLRQPLRMARLLLLLFALPAFAQQPLIDQLDARLYGTRARATVALLNRGPAVLPALRLALLRSRSLEQRRRLTYLIGQLSRWQLTVDGSRLTLDGNEWPDAGGARLIAEMQELRTLVIRGRCRLTVETLREAGRHPALHTLILDTSPSAGMHGAFKGLSPSRTLRRIQMTECTLQRGQLASLARLRALRQLQIFTCINLDESGVAPLFATRTLERIELRDYREPGPVDLAPLGRLPKLTTLILERVDVRPDSYAALARVPCLRRLELVGCPIELRALAELASLETLALDKTQLDDRTLAYLSAGATARSLCTLAIRNAPLTGVGLSALLKMQSLRSLDLAACGALTRVDGLARHPSLTELRLDDCTALTADGLLGLARMPALRVLSLDGVRVGRGHVRAIAGARRLERLRLTRGCAGDHGLVALRALPHLRRLELRGARISDRAMIHALRRWPRLISLDLTGAPLGDEVLAAIAALTPNLRSLTLSDSGVTDAGLGYLGALPRLRELELHRCHELTDAALPALLASRLTSLRLSGERLPTRVAPILRQARPGMALELNRPIPYAELLRPR